MYEFHSFTKMAFRLLKPSSAERPFTLPRGTVKETHRFYRTTKATKIKK